MVIDRIHDRVHKAKDGDYWEVKRSSETKGDKKRDEDQGRRRREQDSFGESSDFIQLLINDPKTYKQSKIDTSRIDKFTFRGVSTHREKALLEVDIALKDGTLIRGAQLAISRQEGMRLISRKPGDDIVAEPLIRGLSHLTVALPQKVPARQKASQAQRAPQDVSAQTSEGLEWYYYALFGVLGLAVVGILYIFFTG